MKILNLKYSKIIPFEGSYAITLFGNIIRRTKYQNTPVSDVVMNHEGIHVCQVEDFVPEKWRDSKIAMFIGYIIFYLLYFIEWVVKLFITIFVRNDAYQSISFEQEAYLNEFDLKYQDTRKRFAWTKYIFKLWN